MKKLIAALLIGFLSPFIVSAGLSIEDCVGKAQANYPAIRKYGLIEATLDIDLSEINKSWLPRIGVYGQATAQNAVPSFPAALSDMLTQFGQNVDGLGKIQYKAGIEIYQAVWDGGATAARRGVARSLDNVRKASVDVELYTVRQRVESIFFAILLTEEQIAILKVNYGLLSKNLGQLRSMLANGAAMQSDVDMVEAQALSVTQAITQAESDASGYRRVLELFIGESLAGQNLDKPSATLPMSTNCKRPELSLFEGRMAAESAARRLSDVSLMPSVGFFAQAFYGYPGTDYFKSMMSRDLSFNALAGIKVSWNIDSFYSKKNSSRRAQTNTDDIKTDKEVFEFNNSLQAAAQTERAEGLRRIIKDDERIVELRENVRKAAESQLENGIIDATTLLSKISDENTARLNAKLNEIRLLQEIYNLKYTLNR